MSTRGRREGLSLSPARRVRGAVGFRQVRNALVMLGTAGTAAGIDLGHKAAAGAEFFHPRSDVYVVAVAVLGILWAVAILLTRSRALALGGGLLVGGAAGNLLSLSFWPGVPNPIEAAPIAFNLADVFVAAGFIVVAATTLALVVRDPQRLREPVRLR